jgi:hypothetical protein
MEKENARQLAIITSEIQQMARKDQDARIAGDASVTIAVDQKNKDGELQKPRELHRERISFRDYVIFDEKPEIIEEWVTQIREIRDAINKHNMENLDMVTRRENHQSHASKVYEILEKEGLDEEDKTLLAIGLWIQREQDKWSNRRIIAKTIIGGTHGLSSFLRNKGKSTCLDLSVLTKRMAENFHIAGDVEFSQLDGRIPHRYFRSNSGKIVDIWLGWKRGGLFQNEKKFEEKEEMSKHLCGK